MATRTLEFSLRGYQSLALGKAKRNRVEGTRALLSVKQKGTSKEGNQGLALGKEGTRALLSVKQKGTSKEVLFCCG